MSNDKWISKIEADTTPFRTEFYYYSIAKAKLEQVCAEFPLSKISSNGTSMGIMGRDQCFSEAGKARPRFGIPPAYSYSNGYHEDISGLGYIDYIGIGESIGLVKLASIAAMNVPDGSGKSPSGVDAIVAITYGKHYSKENEEIRSREIVLDVRTITQPRAMFYFERPNNYHHIAAILMQEEVAFNALTYAGVLSSKLEKSKDKHHVIKRLTEIHSFINLGFDAPEELEEQRLSVLFPYLIHHQ